LKKGQRAELAFDGLSYRADVWLNGQLVASADEFFGPSRQFSFDVTDLLQKENHLAVKVYRWQKGEFNIGFVDWNPRPVDESMGIFRPVWLRFSNEVSMKNPRLWWCHNLGTPEMYSMDLSFVVKGKESDNLSVDFGVREIDSWFNKEGYRGFVLNGKKVLIKGARNAQ
jgi:beta-galactosidase/beta-glucuronidase